MSMTREQRIKKIAEIAHDCAIDGNYTLAGEQIDALVEANPITVDESGNVTEVMMAAAVKAYHDYGRTECEPDFEEALRDAVSAAVGLMPPPLLERLTHPLIEVPMGACKVVLSGNEDGEERELGPFNQGIHLERFDSHAPLTIYDTAGIPTKNAVARFFPNLGWMVEGEAEDLGMFSRAHVQAVFGGMNREIVVDKALAGNVARIRAFRVSDDTPHDLCAAIHEAAETLDTQDVEIVVRRRWPDEVST